MTFAYRILSLSIFSIFLSACTSKNIREVKLQAPEDVDPSAGIKEGWSIVIIPDTQNYAKYAKNQKNFDIITEWIENNLDKWKIKAVLHEGDLVEQNDIAKGGGKGGGDQTGSQQWRSAQKSLSKLYGKVPTVIATGNHDYGFRNSENRRTQFNNYFGLTDNPLTSDARGGGIWREGFPNSFGAITLENAIYTFTASDGRKVLILSLEWGPRNETVEWAKGVLQKPVYKDHYGILLTHSYLSPDSLHDGKRDRGGNPHKYPTGADGNTNDGKDLWEKLVQPSTNINMVMNGHYMGSHVGYKLGKNSKQENVHQMLFNAQGLGGGSYEKGNGGDGWIRIITFEPNKKTASVRTFSPLLLMQKKEFWNKKKGHNFSLDVSKF